MLEAAVLWAAYHASCWPSETCLLIVLWLWSATPLPVRVSLRFTSAFWWCRKLYSLILWFALQFLSRKDLHFYGLLDDPWTRWVPVVTAVDKKNHFKKKKDGTSERYRWGCLHWSNTPGVLAWIGNWFFNNFFVAIFSQNLILHTTDEWWVGWP